MVFLSCMSSSFCLSSSLHLLVDCRVVSVLHLLLTCLTPEFLHLLILSVDVRNIRQEFRTLRATCP
jgi:hypothetical protein